MRELRRIVFCGGGSGGHVFPLLAVYQSLPEPLQRRVEWWGSRRGIERALVAGEGLPYRVVPCGKLRRYFSWRTLPDMLAAAVGIGFCLWHFLRRRPALVLSKGGYVALPVALAAEWLGVPVLTHESDMTPGLATRLLARRARKVLLGWEESRCYFPSSLEPRLLVCGNPVRAEFYQGCAERANREWRLCPDRPLLLVLGGSLGAQEINLLVCQHLSRLLKDFQIVHQCGKAWTAQQGDEACDGLFSRAKAAWAQGKGSPYLPVEFIGRGLADLMAASTVIVARAGAGFLSELLASMRPALLVPLRSGRGEQRRNAESFERAGLAEVLQPEQASQFPERVCEVCARAPDLVEALRKAAGGQRPADRLAALVGEQL